jgi:hypothetical protein
LVVKRPLSSNSHIMLPLRIDQQSSHSVGAATDCFDAQIGKGFAIRDVGPGRVRNTEIGPGDERRGGGFTDGLIPTPTLNSRTSTLIQRVARSVAPHLEPRRVKLEPIVAGRAVFNQNIRNSGMIYETKSERCIGLNGDVDLALQKIVRE